MFHSYGNKNNEVLLQYYGFVEDINVNDYYTADLLQFAKAHGNVSVDRIEEWQASPYLPALQEVMHSMLQHDWNMSNSAHILLLGLPCCPALIEQGACTVLYLGKTPVCSLWEIV